MKKTIIILSLLFLLNGCAESLALLGPASSGFSGGKVAQSAVSSAVSYGVKKQTGTTPSEHALTYVKEYNPDMKKEKCVNFIRATNSEVCAAVKKNILETKKKIVKKSNIKFLNTTP